MCYICGNLNLTDPKHQEKVIHQLDDTELDHCLGKVKSQIRTLEKFPLATSEEDKSLTPKASVELRRLVLGLIGEKLSRVQARRA